MAVNERYVTTMQRILHLRSIPGFSEQSDLDLQQMASIMRPVHFSAGDQLLQSGTPASAFYIILEGQVRIERLGKFFRRVLPHEPPVGVMAAYAQDQEGVDAVAESDVLALEVRIDDILELFEDRSSLIGVSIRAVAGELIHQRQLHGFSKSFAPPVDRPVQVASGPSDIITRVKVLREMLVFAAFRPSLAMELARHSPLMSLLPNTVLWQEGSPSDHFYLILDGVVEAKLQSEPEPFYFGSRDSIGAIAAMAGLPREYTITSQSRISAVRIPTPAYMRLIEDHHEFARDSLSMLARQVLDIYAQVAEDEQAPNQIIAPNRDDDWMSALRQIRS